MAGNMQVTMGTLENPLGGKAAGIVVQAATQKQGPTNKQLTVTLDSIRESVHNQKVEGPYAVRAQRDLENIMFLSKKLLEEKNSNDLLQQLFLHVHQANMEARAKTRAAKAAAPPKDKNAKKTEKAKRKAQKAKEKGKAKVDEVQQKSKEKGSKAAATAEVAMSSAAQKTGVTDAPAFVAAKELVMSLVQSSEFRAMLINLVELGKSTAEMSVDRVKKHEPTKVIAPLANTVQDKVQSTLEAGSPAAATTGTAAVVTETSTTAFVAQATANDAAFVVTETSAAPATTVVASGSTRDNISEARQIGKEVKGAAMETRERARSVAMNIKNEFATAAKEGRLVDNQKLEELKRRAMNIWNDLLQKPELARALRALMNVIDERYKSVSIMSKAQSASNYMQATSVVASPESAKAAPVKLSLADQIWMDIRLLLAQWTGAKELDMFFNTSYQLLVELNNDKEANKLIKDFRKYVDRTIDEPAVARTEKHQAKMTAFFDRAVELFSRWRHNDVLELTMNQARALLLAFKNDQTTSELRAAWSKFAADLVLNEEKRIDFLVTKQALVGMQGMLAPLLKDQFSFIPLPSMSGTSDMVDWSVSNLVINGWKALPAHIQLKAKENLNLDLKDDRHERNNAFAKISLEISNLEIDLRNVHFKYNKKTGFPKLHDEGDADIFVGGADTKLKIKWQVYMDKHRIHFRTSKVSMNIDHLRARFHHVRHGALYAMALSFGNAKIRKSIAKAITDQLYEKLQSFNKMLDRAVYKAQQGLARVPGRIDQALRRASIGANNAAERSRRSARKARKQLRVYQSKASEVAQGVYKPFLDNKGVPLSERAKMASENVKKAVPTPKKSRKSVKSSSSSSKRSTTKTSTASIKPASVKKESVTVIAAPVQPAVSVRQLAESASLSASSSGSESDSEASSTSSTASLANEQVPQQMPAKTVESQSAVAATSAMPLVHSGDLVAQEARLLMKQDNVAGVVTEEIVRKPADEVPILTGVTPANKIMSAGAVHPEQLSAQ